MKKKRFYFLSGLLFLSFSAAAASITQDKIWAGFQITGSVPNSNIVYFLQPQSRSNLTIGRYDNTNTQASLGYRLTPDFTVWLGYTSVIPGASIAQNQIWPQITWNAVNTDTFLLSFRTRIEFRAALHEPGLAERFRQRLTVEFPEALFHKWTPVFWDEIFVNLNHPVWVSPQTIDQNRAFAGVRFPVTKNVGFLIGYLNQYQLRRPVNRDNNVMFINLEIRFS